MSGKNILVVILVPVALAIPVVLVKMLVKQTDPFLPVELLRRYEVVTAEYYGVRLDEKASPRDVAYVLLRSIEDGAKAAEAPTRQEQSTGLRNAREIQLAVAAPLGILHDLLGLRAETPDTRSGQERILTSVLSWSQMLQFYCGGFGLDQHEAWEERIDPGQAGQTDRAVVRLVATKNGYKTMVLVRFVREAGRWRIFAVQPLEVPATMPTTRRVTITPQTVPAPAPAPGAEPPKVPPPPAPPPASAPAAGPPATVPTPVTGPVPVPPPPAPATPSAAPASTAPVTTPAAAPLSSSAPASGPAAPATVPTAPAPVTAAPPSATTQPTTTQSAK